MEDRLTPQEYFDKVKDKKQHCTDEMLTKVYDNCLYLLNKYKTTNQRAGMRKLLFHLQCLEKEREIVKLGVDTFIYRDDIEDYIDNVADDAVKVIELENYEREIPDDIVDVIEKVKDKFDKLYVVFTDYTGKVERRVEKERRAKDPILFGAFANAKERVVVDRFYYLGDWIDEYCDLTLDKLVNEVSAKQNKNISHEIKTPKDIEDLREQLAALSPSREDFFRVSGRKDKKSFFSKIKSIFTKK